VSFLAVLGGLPPGSVSAILGDSLRIRPLLRALLLTCPQIADPRPGPPRWPDQKPVRQLAW